MKATGIVRRIDDLGRVVIPKEIRRTMRIREGDPLEIFTDKDGEVIFKKYSLMGNQSEFAGQICEVLNKSIGKCVAVSDGDTIISCSGVQKRELEGAHISEDLEKLLQERTLYKLESTGTALPVCGGSCDIQICVSAPIISGGDVLGSVLIIRDEKSSLVTELELRLAQAMALFLARHMEM